MSIFYMLTKSSHRKPAYFLSRVKKRKFGVKEFFQETFLLSFLQRTHKMPVSAKLDERTSISVGKSI